MIEVIKREDGNILEDKDLNLGSLDSSIPHLSVVLNIMYL